MTHHRAPSQREQAHSGSPQLTAESSRGSIVKRECYGTVKTFWRKLWLTFFIQLRVIDEITKCSLITKSVGKP
jgi:hypothetical protein